MEINVIIPILTFVVGLLVGLFYKYSDITGMKKDIENLKETLKVLSIVDLASNVKSMKDSVLFDPTFQQHLTSICSQVDTLQKRSDANDERIRQLEIKEH